MCNVWGSYRNPMGMWTFRQNISTIRYPWVENLYSIHFILTSTFVNSYLSQHNVVWCSYPPQGPKFCQEGRRVELNYYYSLRSRCKGTGTSGIKADTETGQRPWLTSCRRAACFSCPCPEQVLMFPPSLISSDSLSSSCYQDTRKTLIGKEIPGYAQTFCHWFVLIDHEQNTFVRFSMRNIYVTSKNHQCVYYKTILCNIGVILREGSNYKIFENCWMIILKGLQRRRALLEPCVVKWNVL